MTRKKNNALKIFFTSASFADFFLLTIFNWFRQNFTVGLEGILYTLQNPVQGGDFSFFLTFLRFMFLKVAFFCAAIFFFFFFCAIFKKSHLYISVRILKKQKKFDVENFFYIFCVASVLLIFVYAVCAIWNFLGVKEFYQRRSDKSSIYENFYVEPGAEKISGSGKNLIWIYLESMETTYAHSADSSAGGKNLIPHLSHLAEENVNFSESDGLGGFRSGSGSSWTMGALFSTSTGIPFNFPFQGNSMGLFKNSAESIVSIGDILKQKGYTNEFLCGSDGNFGGRKKFFEQNGSYKVFDLYEAKEKRIVPLDYFVWWGIEDQILYKIARDELLRLSKNSSPFNLTILTVDTHFYSGYVCKICPDEFSLPACNVISCADSQIYDFVQWIKAQDFFKDTLIVISGDHPRMDNLLVEGEKFSDRTVYDCFINAPRAEKSAEKNRCFTAQDMFPTVLSAMGFSVDGERLGLGTNLFSGKKTLAEEMGYESFDAELSKFSDFYAAHFW
jgi:phosphoglycerol transferase